MKKGKEKKKVRKAGKARCIYLVLGLRLPRELIDSRAYPIVILLFYILSCERKTKRNKTKHARRSLGVVTRERRNSIFDPFIAQFDASRRGMKLLKRSRDKNARRVPQRGEGRRGMLCYPGSELRLCRERAGERRARTIEGMRTPPKKKAAKAIIL